MAVDRRVLRTILSGYNDEHIKCLICFVCAQRKICTTSEECRRRFGEELRERSDMCVNEEERARSHRRIQVLTDHRDDREECEHSSRSPIAYRPGSFLLGLEEEVQKINFDFHEFQQKAAGVP